VGGVLVIFTQNILLDLHHPLLTDPRRMSPSNPRTVIQRILAVVMIMVVVMVIMIGMMMGVTHPTGTVNRL
jgi:hypothetical protein